MDGTDGTDLTDGFVDQQGTFMMEADGMNDSQLGEGAEGEGDEALREQDRFLPIANVARIMKNAIPKNGKIAKDAKECVQECVSEFISFITSEASERCHQEKRKTINGEDILFAMSTLGFDNYMEPLKLYLQKYRESIKGDSKPESIDVIENLSEDQLASMTTNILDQGSQGIVYQLQPTTTVQQFNIG